MEEKRLTAINPVEWYALRKATIPIVGLLLFILVLAISILVFKIIFVIFNSYFLSSSTVLKISLFFGFIFSLSFIVKKFKDKGNEIEIKNNHVGVIKFFGNVTFFRKSFLSHGKFSNFTIFSGKLFAFDVIKLLHTPTEKTAQNITTNDGIPVKIRYTSWKNAVDHIQVHKLDHDSTEGKNSDEFIYEKVNGILRSVLNKLPVDAIDITKEKDKLQYLFNLAMLRNPSFFLPQKSIDRLYFPREIDHHDLKREKDKRIYKILGTMDEEKDMEFLVSEEENPNLVFFYPRIGSNISITIQEAIIDDTETLSARARSVKQQAENKAEKLKYDFKLKMQKTIQKRLRDIYSRDDVDDQMILRVALLITDEYKDEKLIDFGGIGGLDELAAVAKNIISKIK